MNVQSNKTSPESGIAYLFAFFIWVECDELVSLGSHDA